MKLSKIIMLVALTTFAVAATAGTIFSEDFQDADISAWSTSGSGSAIASLYYGNYTLRTNKTKSATANISTQGYTEVTVSVDLAAYSLESTDMCYAEASTDGGSTWSTLVSIANGSDNSSFYSYSGSPTNADDNSNFQLRVRSAGNRTNDYCYLDNIVVEGIEEDTDITCDYDCLSGDGNVSRSTVTYSNLTGSTGNGSLVDFDGFSLPTGAANPSNTFEGTLSFNGIQRGWAEVYDPYFYDTLSGVKQLPDFDYKFIQHGTHIIPQTRGLIESATTLGEWDLILEPGRVWDEESDSGYSRASIPFALVEYNQNCTHNGALTFLFNDAGDISNVQYQITSETCAYYQFNMYGRLSASYSQESLSGSAALKSSYETEVSSRMTTKAISALATDYPSSGINVNNIASDQDSDDLSLFGVVYNNIHYVGGCETRYGTYPFCDVMSLPSYSTAKSTVGALSLMRLEQKYAGAKDTIVKDNVSECSDNSKWGSVTLENALDMATGNYDASSYESDEVDYAVDWLYSNTHSEKVDISCNFYDHKENAGQTWVYHSSDTYLVGLGVNNYLQSKEGSSSEFFTDMLVNDVFSPLGLSPSMSKTIRTRDTESAAATALGLFYHRDDVVKLANMLNNDNGMINGTQILDADMVSATLQRDASDRGLPTDPTESTSTSNYNNGFWSYDLSASSVMDSCSNQTWIPYMSGYGGIGVQMLPNGMTYYFFSDGFDHSFTTTMNELDKVSTICD